MIQGILGGFWGLIQRMLDFFRKCRDEAREPRPAEDDELAIPNVVDYIIEAKASGKVPYTQQDAWAGVQFDPEIYY